MNLQCIAGVIIDEPQFPKPVHEEVALSAVVPHATYAKIKDKIIAKQK